MTDKAGTKSLNDYIISVVVTYDDDDDDDDDNYTYPIHRSGVDRISAVIIIIIAQSECKFLPFAMSLASSLQRRRIPFRVRVSDNALTSSSTASTQVLWCLPTRSGPSIPTKESAPR